MSSEPNASERYIATIQAIDGEGHARWLYVLFDPLADKGVAGPVVLNVTTSARDDDPHGWCGDTFWLSISETETIAAALRRATSAGRSAAAALAELTAQSGNADSAWLRIRQSNDGASTILDFAFAELGLSIILAPTAANGLADALELAIAE